ATVAWWATDWAPADAPTPGRAVVAAPATAHPPFAECAVEYQLLHDDGRRFTAAVTVTNLDSTVLRGWSVALRLPGDQRIDPVRSPGWTQKGDLVMAPPQRDVLNPGGSARRTVTGLHPGVTRLPTVFTLDGSPCAVTLLGQTGQALSATSGAVLAGGTAEGGGSGGGGGSRSRGAGKGKPTR
ncbi:MAG: hypothetical protein HOV79_35060, partial [Hamadaea sp.]|nr:hypothetical protein [Hamadaea sp.]